VFEVLKALTLLQGADLKGGIIKASCKGGRHFPCLGFYIAKVAKCDEGLASRISGQTDLELEHEKRGH
jgi:hypothetical protein